MRHVAIVLIPSFLLALFNASLAVYIMFEDNNQGEVIDMDTGVIDFVYIASSFFSVFVIVCATSAVIISILYFFFIFVFRLEKSRRQAGDGRN